MVQDSLGILGGQENKKQEVKDSLGILGKQTRQPAAKDSLGILGPASGSPKQGKPKTYDISPDFTQGTRATQTEIVPQEKPKREQQKPLMEQFRQIPRETAGLVTRSFSKTAEMLDRGIATILDAGGKASSKELETLGLDQPPVSLTDPEVDQERLRKGAQFMREQADVAKDVTERMRTDLTDPRFDLAASIMLGGVGAGVGYATVARNLPKALRGVKAVMSAIGTGSTGAAATDYGINRVMSNLDPLIQKSNLSPTAKQVIRMSIDMGVGIFSAATVEARFAKMLGDPTFAKTINQLVKESGSPEDALDAVAKYTDVEPEEYLANVGRDRTRRVGAAPRIEKPLTAPEQEVAGPVDRRIIEPPRVEDIAERATVLPELPGQSVAKVTLPPTTRIETQEIFGKTLKTIDETAEKKYNEILEIESGLTDPGLEKIETRELFPEELDSILNSLKGQDKQEYIEGVRATLADQIGDLTATFKYGYLNEARAIEDYVDAMLEVTQWHKVQNRRMFSNRPKAGQFKKPKRAVPGGKRDDSDKWTDFVRHRNDLITGRPVDVPEVKSRGVHLGPGQQEAPHVRIQRTAGAKDISPLGRDQEATPRDQAVSRIVRAADEGDIFDAHAKINEELDAANLTDQEVKAIGDALDSHLDDLESGIIDQATLTKKINDSLAEAKAPDIGKERDVSAVRAMRDQELELYEKGVGRIREIGGLNYDDVLSNYGQQGIEDLRKKFGVAFVRKKGEPLDTMAQILQDEAPDLGIREGTPDELMDFLLSRARSKKQIQREFSAQGTFVKSDPSALFGSIAGISEDENGNLTVDPREVLIGMAAGAALVRLTPPGRKLARKIGKGWDEKFASPFLDFVKDRVNRRITNEFARTQLGMGRDQAMKDTMREYSREVEAIWERSLELGQQLQALAPTRAEQKRLLQIIKGSVTGSPELQKKAQKVQKLFQTLREQSKQANLLEYSRFDKLTRKERAFLNKKLRTPDPATIDDPDSLMQAAEDLGVLEGIPEKKLNQIAEHLYSQDPDLKDMAKWQLRDAMYGQLEFYKSRLRDHYHYGTAQEYAPLMYSRHEGMTRKEKKELSRAINDLKKKSRRATPEGKQELEEIIVPLEKVLRGERAKGKSPSVTKMDLGHTKQRKDLPRIVQKMLGVIEEAPYPVAKGAATQATDIRKARLFQEIADHPEWAFKPGKKTDLPGNFRMVEDERFGALQGMAVRQDVYEDLKTHFNISNEFLQLYDQALGLWKYGKVVLNPATHARNFMSNAILADFGDLSPGDIKTYSRAIKEIKNSGDFYNEAKEWGLFRTSFAATELKSFRDDLGKLRSGEDMKSWIRKAANFPAKAYEANEHLFKMALYTKKRAEGASIDEAAKHAERHIFNYSDIPPIVRHVKRWWSPFFTFTYKALPMTAETMIRKPWKIGMLTAGTVAAEELAKKRFGRSDKEQAEREKAQPDWLQGPFQVLMPFKDKWGNDLFLDLEFILPYGDIAGDWGQSPLPGPVTPLAPQHPALDFLMALKTNKDPFTGRPIFYEHADTATQVIKKYLDYAWKSAMPSMTPGGYSWNKLRAGLKNAFLPESEKMLDWADRPRGMGTAIGHALLGIKLNPVDTKRLQESLSYERSQAKREFGIKKRKLRGMLRRNEIDHQEFTEKRDKILRHEREVLKTLNLRF